MSKQHLIIDNGSYNIKAGFNLDTETTTTTTTNTNTVEEQKLRSKPIKIFNAITKTKDGLIHIGNQFKSHSNEFTGLQIKRPFDQGHLTSWETEKPIWDYTFDQIQNEHSKKEFDPSEINLILTETPFQLPQLSSNTDQIIFEEYGFNDYYRCISASLVPFSIDQQKVNRDFTLIIDSGFNSTWIIPMIYQKVYWEGVKKLPVGGNLINGLLKEIINFRHYDISEDPILINTIKESTCFIAENFNETLLNKRQQKCEFVLPDFKTTTTGFVKTKNSPSISSDSQILKLYDERFIIPETLYHPEIIFELNSTTASNPIIQSTPIKNLTDLIVSSIMSCPEITRPLLTSNIVLVGGTTNLKNFKSRLSDELTKELPQKWVVKIHDNPPNIKQDEMSWYGGLNLSNDEILNKISISKKDYFEHGSNWCQKQFGFKSI
ncbi:ARP6 [Candida pseudojiufengensis]|uniref:ARP6 n=1 Tax=Candida pseudojiufengensis TaxID=497109 RepID=UPI0022241C68|nr:ARP6 [Candida pseudojiufengensis]KAI5960582.1 ARP6 [Candida pseudojiufengensis]